MFGLGNIIQNATEHAKKMVNVSISWDKKFLFISVKDDGVGFKNTSGDYNAFIGYLAGGVDSNTLNVIYNLADFVNKIAFGLVIWACAMQNTSLSRR